MLHLDEYTLCSQVSEFCHRHRVVSIRYLRISSALTRIEPNQSLILTFARPFVSALRQHYGLLRGPTGGYFRRGYSESIERKYIPMYTGKVSSVGA